jgi:hypothetical protein
LLGNPKQIAKTESSLNDADEILNSGEITRHSGLYRLQHDSHAVEKEIFIRRGTILPPCHDCGKPVTFLLLRKVEHIDEDPDFQ